jgi:hypothetical protein
LIFPEVDGWPEGLEDPADTQCPKSTSAIGFLKMPKEFRSVILQDVAVFRSMDPLNELFNHPLFKSNEFNDFASACYESMHLEEMPAFITLR